MLPLFSWERNHASEKRWSAEFGALRQLCLATELNEEPNRGQACCDFDRRNIVVIHGCKHCCALRFMKGALLHDPGDMLLQQTKNMQVTRQIEFADLPGIDTKSEAIKRYLSEAIAVESSGAKVEMKSAAQFDVPAEFLKRLDDDFKLAEAFHALTPGRQKGHLLHFAGAKQSATRSARVGNHVSRTLARLGLDDEESRGMTRNDEE